jgi:hypothetical protein
VRYFDATGGTIEHEFYGSAVVPAGAVAAETEFRIEVNPEFGEDFWAPHLPDGYNGYGGEHCFGPYGQTFAQPLTVTIVARTNQTPEGLSAFRLDNQLDETWTSVAADIGEATLESGTYSVPVTITTTQLGCFALGKSSF